MTTRKPKSSGGLAGSLLLFVLVLAGCAGHSVAERGRLAAEPKALETSTGRNESSTINWADSAWCVDVRVRGGNACDEHQFSVYPAITDVVRHGITSLPDGVQA
jgi:hypothetical protein